MISDFRVSESIHEATRNYTKSGQVFRVGSCCFVEKFLLLAFLSYVATSACQTQRSSDSRGIIVVNAPAAGEVRRVLVREGIEVNEGTPVVEIAVRSPGQVAPPSATEDPQARA